MRTTDNRVLPSLALALLLAGMCTAPRIGEAICGNPSGCDDRSPSPPTIDCGKLNACSECNAGPLACCLTPPCTIVNPPPPPKDVLKQDGSYRRGFGYGFIFTK